MHLDHIAIAVENLDTAIALYEKLLGVKCAKKEVVESESVRVAKFHLDNCRIELLEPLNSNSPISSFLAKRGPGLHHMALAPEGFESTLKRVGKDFELLGKGPHRGSDDMLIQFVHPKSASGVLVEFCKPKK